MLNLARQIAALQQMTTAELRAKYAEAFGEGTNVNNRAWLVKRLAWRLQALAEGDFSERARQRARELACDADLRSSPPRTAHPVEVGAVPAGPTRSAPPRPDPRLPPVGTILRRRYKGMLLQVQVQAEGLVFDGHRYPSLSAVAKAITGSHCNGFLFFRLIPKGAAS